MIKLKSVMAMLLCCTLCLGLSACGKANKTASEENDAQKLAESFITEYFTVDLKDAESKIDELNNDKKVPEIVMQSSLSDDLIKYCQDKRLSVYMLNEAKKNESSAKAENVKLDPAKTKDSDTEQNYDYSVDVKYTDKNTTESKKGYIYLTKADDGWQITGFDLR